MTQIELTKAVILYRYPLREQTRKIRDIRNTVIDAREVAQTQLSEWTTHVSRMDDKIVLLTALRRDL